MRTYSLSQTRVSRRNPGPPHVLDLLDPIPLQISQDKPTRSTSVSLDLRTRPREDAKIDRLLATHEAGRRIPEDTRTIVQGRPGAPPSRPLDLMNQGQIQSHRTRLMVISCRHGPCKTILEGLQDAAGAMSSLLTGLHERPRDQRVQPISSRLTLRRDRDDLRAGSPGVILGALAPGHLTPPKHGKAFSGLLSARYRETT
jgi:hypothetical protein